jgi:hypothetical protein
MPHVYRARTVTAWLSSAASVLDRLADHSERSA